MRRIAIIDHNEHDLIIEDINEELLEKEYGGDEQKYIDANYDLENYSWDWITNSYYMQDGDNGNAVEIDFNSLVISEHEKLRRKISSVCSALYATEQSPIKCDEEEHMMLTIGHDEAMGLSELELPQVTEIFHDYEGIVWVKVLGEGEPRELDELSTSDLKDIFKWIEEELHIS